MTPRLPALDMHAHIDVNIDAAELVQLPGIVFAACRTLAESRAAQQRRDLRVVWGVGCHPGLARNHTNFDAAEFEDLVTGTPYVSEIGLDGSSKGGLARQIVTFDAILDTLQRHPRLVSIHSAGAHDEVLAALAHRPIRGAILHWWTGSPEQTQRAVELNCYFSMNASAMKRIDALGQLPLDRILPETDHPFGDRSAPQPRMPGSTTSVETALGRHFGSSAVQVRAVAWRNLSQLVRDTGCSALFNRSLLNQLAAAS
ncbi:TatD family hydrolase [Micromonospora sp. NPDC047187]|uniref:TatD family hydrolase n=1 Tax=Micromonospora sp. NPDC047187 TaxID=3155262 RepID=UPI0033ED8B3B